MSQPPPFGTTVQGPRLQLTAWEQVEPVEETVYHLAVDLGRAIVMSDHVSCKPFSGMMYALNASLTDYDTVLTILDTCTLTGKLSVHY